MGKQGCQSGDWWRKKISLPIVREGIEELVRKEIVKAGQLCCGIALNLIAAGTLQVHTHLVGGLPRRLSRCADNHFVAQAVAEGDALLTIGLTIGNDAAAVELLLRRKGSTMAVCAVPLRIREATRT